MLAKLMDDVRRRLTAEWKGGNRRALREEVNPTIDSQPDVTWRCVTCVMAPCRTAWHTSATCRGCGLSREALIEEYGNPEIVNALPSRRSRPWSWTRVAPGRRRVPSCWGKADGRSMIDALTALAKEKAALTARGDKRSVRAKRTDDEVDRMMLERHGSVLTDGSI